MATRTNVKKDNLVDYVQDQLISMVFSKEYDFENSSGDFIFTEGELSEKYGVSRTTIREAVRSLEVRGFVERVHGVGIRLIDKSLQVVTRSLSDMLMRSGVDYSELLEVRRIIEVQACRLAATRATKELDEMCKAIAIMEDTNVTYNDYVNADFEFHSLVVKSTKNKTLRALVKSYEFIFKNLILASTSPDFRPEVTLGFHKNVYNCIINRDPDGAAKAMMEHLNATEKNLTKLQDENNERRVME